MALGSVLTQASGCAREGGGGGEREREKWGVGVVASSVKGWESEGMVGIGEQGERPSERERENLCRQVCGEKSK